MRKNGTLLAVSALLLGISSYWMLLIGARLIDPKIFGSFVVIWAAFNTVTLSMVGPLDLLLPRSRPHLEKSGFSDPQIFLSTLITSFGFGILSGLIIWVYSALYSPLSTITNFSLFLAAIALSIFTAVRVNYTAAEKYRKALYLAFFSALISSITYFLVYRTKQESPAALVFAVVLGAVLPALLFATRDGLLKSVGTNSTKVPMLSFRAAYLSVLTMGLFQLLLNNGALISAEAIGVSSSIIVAWAGVAGLIRIPLTLLNSFTPPVLNKISTYITDNHVAAIRVLYTKTMSAYAAAMVFVIGGFALFGGSILSIYLGNQYSLSRQILVAICVGEALIAFIGMPRAFLIALGHEKDVTWYWFIAVLFFFIVLVLPIPPVIKLTLAPILGGAVALVLSLVKINKILVEYAA